MSTDNPPKSDSLSPVKLALIEIRDLRKQLAQSQQQLHEPVAIIGMGCRFPGGINSPEDYWQQLLNGVDAIEQIPPDRWEVEAYYDPDPDAPGKMSTKCGGFLDQIDRFDADFFRISHREAVTMDPQQRLLLEVAWESLENAGLAPHTLYGSAMGVYVGIGGFDYGYLHLRDGDPQAIDAYLATGFTHSVASGRLSYALGLQGPSVSIDTACSSSLVAVHQAVQSLRLRECDLALAGGVNLILTPEFHINFSKAHVLAADGRCKAFDASADGFVRSEGCGLVVLQRLSEAMAEGAPILAVIKGSAINQDGRSSGLTVPNGPSQQTVVRKALANANVDPNQIHYVEAHGTGTSLGDPIEVQALAAVFGQVRTKADPLLIGSAKTNIGHLETAAGVAGLMKLVLAVRYGVIPPHLHLKHLNPHIPWQDIPVKVTSTATSWPHDGQPRIGGVSAFGFSGTNAHVIITQAPIATEEENQTAEFDRPLHILPLSARSDEALEHQISRYAQSLANRNGLDLGDVCYTAGAGRTHFDHRAIFVVENMDEMRARLSDRQRTPTTTISTGERKGETVFLFTGQESQYVNMGRQLYETQPVFRESLDRCAGLFEPFLEVPLASVLYPAKGASASHDIKHFAQPALFAFEYAMSSLWRSWGIEPTAVIGHSLGEYVAACVAGVFNLPDAVRLICERTRLIGTLPENGMMVAVFASEEVLRSLLQPYVDQVAIAAVNGPEHTVISGDRQAAGAMLDQLKRRGIRFIPLQVSHAFHSPLVAPVIARFESIVNELESQPPRIPMVSNVTGAMVPPEQVLDAAYWGRHIQETVQFAAGIKTLYSNGHRLFVEMGPHPMLGSLGAACVDGEALWLPSVRRGRPDWQEMLFSLGQLYVQGAVVNWTAFDSPYRRHKVWLPTYPFQRERCWLDCNHRGGKTALITPKAEEVWDTVITSGIRQAEDIPSELVGDNYVAKWQAMNNLCLAFMQKALCDAGLFQKAGESQTLDAIIACIAARPTYRNLLGRWMTHLCEQGLLERSADTFKSPEAFQPPDIEALSQTAGEALTSTPLLTSYLERCGQNLLNVLTGRQSPLETLFPAGSLETAVQIHHHWAVSSYFNRIAASLVKTLVHAMAGDQTVRILEVGAGVGGMTAAILPGLPADRTEYWYTDVSEFFFAGVQDRFVDFPFVRFGRLDIEASPLEQGYGAHVFDIVIAGNTLHGTRNIDLSLNHTRSLIKPSGALLICETTRQLPWFDMTFGLLEMERDPNDPLRLQTLRLSVAQWEATLQKKGFCRTAHFPTATSTANGLAQHILIAQQAEHHTNGEVVLSTDFSSAWQSSGSEAVSVAAKALQNRQEHTQEHTDVLKAYWDAPKIDRNDMLVEFVRTNVMRVLRRDPSKPVARNKRLMDLGVDSLMAVELRTSLKKGLGWDGDLPATLIFDYPTVAEIAAFLEEQLNPNDHSIDAPNTEITLIPAGDEALHAAVDIEAFDEDEMEALLKARLDMLEKGN